LILVGVQDISSWVDFTRVAQAGEAAGLELCDLRPRRLLIGSGIEELLLADADDITRARRTGEAGRLLLPAEMGEAFKVMALGRGLRSALPASPSRSVAFALESLDFESR